MNQNQINQRDPNLNYVENMKHRGVECLLGEPWASLYRPRWGSGQGKATSAIRVFILCAPWDQTDLKSMEGYFAWLPRRRGRRLQKAAGIGRSRALTGPRVGPTGPTFSPLRLSFLRVSSRPFLSLLVMFFGADEFCGKYALESLFLALCEIDPGKYKICKTHGNCQIKPQTNVFSCVPLCLKF